MADNVIGIKFGVAGGKGFQAGSSGALIKEQLNSLAGRIKLKVHVSQSFFRNELKKLKSIYDQWKSGLEGVEVSAKLSTKVAAGAEKTADAAKKEEVSYESLRKDLQEIYTLKTQIANSKAGNTKTPFTTEKLKELEESYEKQKQQLHEIGKADTSRTTEIEKQIAALKELEKAAGKALESSTMASPAAVAKMRVRVQALSTDNGYDKVIRRDPKSRASVANLQKEWQDLEEATKGNIPKKKIDEFNESVLKTEAELKKAGETTNTLGNKIKEAFNARVVQRIAQMIIMYIVKALRQVLENVKKIDKAMTQLQIVTGATSNQMKSSAKEIAKTAKEIGASIADLTNSTTTFARLGYDMATSQALAKFTTIYSNIANIDVDTATTNLTAAIKAFNITSDELESALDKFVYVGKLLPKDIEICLVKIAISVKLQRWTRPSKDLIFDKIQHMAKGEIY